MSETFVKIIITQQYSVALHKCYSLSDHTLIIDKGALSFVMNILYLLHLTKSLEMIKY